MLPRDLIKKVRKIEIYTSKLANDQLAGQYHSVFKGRGMAFSEVRQYQHGDDIRFIDWNVTARTGDVFVKLFTEEREMTVMLLVDLSRSEAFGTQRMLKSEVVAEVAAILAFSAIKNNDRVGLILFTDRIEKFVPPKKGRKHVLRVITEILTSRPKGTRTDLGVALDLLGNVTRRRSVAFLLSDFIASGYERPLRIASHRHDLVPVIVSDPREDELPRMGVVLFEDRETGQVIPFDTGDPRARDAYRLQVARERGLRQDLFSRLSLDSVQVRTDRDAIRPLVDFFALRAKRLRRQ